MSYVSPAVQAVIDVFQGPLADVRFADVEASALVNLAHAAELAAADLAQHEAQLSELRQALADRQEALLVLAQRGLAYARVYAEHDEALSEQLSRITLPKATKPRKANSKAVEPARPEPSSPPEAAASAEAGMTESAGAVLDAPPNEQLASDEPAAAVKPSAKSKRRSVSRDAEEADSPSA